MLGKPDAGYQESFEEDIMHNPNHTGKMAEPRSRATLNAGLAELKSIIPELDGSERAQLSGILGDALIELVGFNGSFFHADDKWLYLIELTPIPHTNLTQGKDDLPF